MQRELLAALVFCAILAACVREVDQKTFDGVYRAGKSIEGATAVGVAYQQFSQLLQNLAIEIAIANDKVRSDKEKELLRAYPEVLGTHRDSRAVWRLKIESLRHSFVPEGKIFVHKWHDDLRRVVQKYKVPVEMDKDLNYYIPEDSIQRIWATARKQLEKADAVLLGKR